MKQTEEYGIEAVFPDRRALESFIKGHHPQQDGTILLYGESGYIARYDPERDKILLELTGDSEDEIVESNLRFFRDVDFRNTLYYPNVDKSGGKPCAPASFKTLYRYAGSPPLHFTP